MLQTPHPFDTYVQGGTPVLRVARAALLFALDRYPRLDIERYLARLDGYGLIRFGSRMDTFLPIGTKIRVAIGDRVKGGETIVGELP